MNEETGAQLFRTLARTMIELSGVGRTGVISLPYPPFVQRTLDHIVSVCLERGERPPSGVPELVTWCAERTPVEWPFPVPVDLVRPEAVLLHPEGRVPTRTCLELASSGNENSPAQQAQDLLRQFGEGGGTSERTCRVREFLIGNPIVPNDFTLRHPRNMAMWRAVRDLYERVPAAAFTVDRRVPICGTCRLLGRVKGRQLTWCEAELCPRDASPSFVKADSVWLLRNPLRIFLALPGQTELRIRDELAAVGVRLTLVDAISGSYQLSTPVRGKQILRIVDRVEPTLLAAVAREWRGSLVVVPHRIIDRITGYRAAFDEALLTDTESTLVSDSELIAIADTKAKEIGRA